MDNTKPDAPLTVADATEFVRKGVGRVIEWTSGELDTMPRPVKIWLFVPIFLSWMALVFLFGFADFISF